MRNNDCCTFGFCQLIISAFIGGIVAALVFSGTIAVATITALLPTILIILGVLLVLAISIVINLNSIDAVTNQNDRGKCCSCCCICPLLQTLLVSVLISIVASIIASLVTLASTSLLTALLLFVLFTTLAFSGITLIELVLCILSKICNR